MLDVRHLGKTTYRASIVNPSTFVKFSVTEVRRNV